METTPGSARALRPLGIGEVLDRAVNLCVRFFVPLALVYVVFAVPEGISQFFAGRSFSRVVDVLTAAAKTQAATGRPADPVRIVHELSATSAASGPVALSSLFVILCAPLAFAALIDMTSARYLGRARSWAQSYRLAFERWLPLLGLNLIFIVLCVFAYVAVLLVVLVLGLGIGALYAASHPLALALAVPLALAAALLGLAATIVGGLGLQLSNVTCVLERVSSVRALGLGFARVTGKIGLGRALLFAAAYFAIVVGVAIVGLAGEAAFTTLVHSELAADVYALVLRLVTAIFTTAFICIFYYDLRVREEGFDLQLAAQELLR